MFASRTFAIRQVLITACVFAALPTAVVRAESKSSLVQYVGGTVKSIPVNSTGTFNFDDAKEFRFIYNDSVYKLAYDQITSTDIEKADVRRVMHVFPAMSPIAAHRKQTLVINYTDANGANGTVKFELMAYRAIDAQQTLAAKKSPISPAAAAAASNQWWGDQFWKTTRNLPQWEAQEAAIKASQEEEAAKKAEAAKRAEAQKNQEQLQPGQIAGGTK